MMRSAQRLRRKNMLRALFVLVLLASPALAGGGFTIDFDGTLYAIDCATSRTQKLGVVRAGGGDPLVLTDLGTGPRGALYGISDVALYAIDTKDPGKSRRIGDHGLVG